jgi:hypothetical protein
MRRFRRYLRRRIAYTDLMIMRLVWPLWRHLLGARRTWPEHVRLCAKAQRATHGFDMRWLSTSVSLLVVPVFLAFVPGAYDVAVSGLSMPQIPPAVLNVLAVIGTVIQLLFGAVLTAYFCFLLTRRLQCGLLEWCAIVVLLGNLEGLVLTTPGVLSSPAFAALTGLIVAAFVFYGAVVGLIEIRLLGVSHPLARVGVLIAAWWRLAVVPLILGGCFLAFEEYLPSRGNLVGPKLAAWGLPFVVAGIAGLLESIAIRYRARRACWLVLNSWLAQTVKSGGKLS